MTTRAPETRPSRLRQLLSESTLYTLGNVARRSFSLITMPVFTRYLSTSGYGLLSIVGTVQNMLEVFYELGMGQSSTRFYYECRDARERQTLFGTLLILSLAVTAVLSVLLLLVGEWLWGFVAPDVPFYPYIGLTIATVFFGGIGVLPRALFRVENQVPRFFRLSVSQTALTVVLALVFVVGFAVGPVGPILATCLVAVIYFVVYACALRGRVRFAFDWDLARRALAFGLPEVPLRWGQLALKVSDRLILQHFATLSVVGVYSVGYAVGKMPFDLVANGIHWAIVPFFYATATQESDARSKRIFAEVATWNVVILAGLGLATVVFAAGDHPGAGLVQVRRGPSGRPLHRRRLLPGGPVLHPEQGDLSEEEDPVPATALPRPRRDQRRPELPAHSRLRHDRRRLVAGGGGRDHGGADPGRLPAHLSDSLRVRPYRQGRAHRGRPGRGRQLWLPTPHCSCGRP